jgi:prepilin-type N-terminal cleavage/methylation domain-containing protein
MRKSLDFGRKRCARASEKGFTLIEMMIVVTIIAILSALLVPRVNNQLNESRRVATVADLNAVNTVWTSYLLMTGRSMGFSEPVLTPDSFQPVSAADLASFLHAEIPEVDHFNHPIDYRVDVWPDPNFLVARSPGKDGIFDTSYQMEPNRPNRPCADIFIEDIVVVNGITMAKLRNPPCWPKD